MRYLVTGAAGFVGARVVAQLLDAGYGVVGLDNLSDAYDVRVKQHRLEAIRDHSRFRFAEVDIAKRDSIQSALADSPPFDAVVNLAARAGVRTSVLNPWIYVETNVTGTLNLLELCRERGIPKFVLSSTSSLYGRHNAPPFREDADTSRPLSPYAATKGAAEAMAHTYHQLHGIDVTVLRYFTVYGPAGRPDMSVFRFIQRIREGRQIELYGDGEQQRDFTYVDDVARGTVAGLKPLGFEVVNIGGDHPYQLNELIAMIEEVLDRKADILRSDHHPADMQVTWADLTKARALLGYEPQVSLEEGVRRSVAWYEAQREWAKDVETSG